jgi:phage FluMu protein Com
MDEEIRCAECEALQHGRVETGGLHGFLCPWCGAVSFFTRFGLATRPCTDVERAKMDANLDIAEARRLNARLREMEPARRSVWA